MPSRKAQDEDTRLEHRQWSRVIGARPAPRLGKEQEPGRYLAPLKDFVSCEAFAVRHAEISNAAPDQHPRVLIS
jgi:hypothetical protein